MSVLTVDATLSLGGTTRRVFHFMLGSSTGSCGEISLSNTRMWILAHLVIRIIILAGCMYVYAWRFNYFRKDQTNFRKMVVEDIGSLCTIIATFCVASAVCLHHLKHKMDNDNASPWKAGQAKDKPGNYYNLYAFASFNPVFYWPGVGGRGK